MNRTRGLNGLAMTRRGETRMKSPMNIHLKFSLVALFAAASFVAGPVEAQTWTTTTGSSAWSTAGNWSPAVPVSGTSTIVTFFSGTTTLPTGAAITANNDLSPNPLVVNQLNIRGTGPGAGSAALTINGNGIALDGTNAQLNINPTYGSGGGYTVTLANPLTFNAATAINFGSGGGNINTAGAWNGSGDVTFTGSYTNRPLTLTAAAGSFSGNLILAGGTNTVVSLTGANSALGPNSSTTQSVIIGSGAGLNRDYGNAAYTNAQNFILNGSGNAGSSNAALNITNANFGNGVIGGLAVNSSSTIRVAQNTASNAHGVTLTRGLVGTGDLVKTGNGFLYTNAVGGSSTWAGTTYALFSGNLTINEGVVQTPALSNTLGSGTTQTVLVNSGAAMVLGANNNSWVNPQNFVVNGAGTGYVAQGSAGISAFSSANVGFGSNVAGSLSVQTDSSVTVGRTAGDTTRGLTLTRGLFGDGTLSINNTVGTNSGIMYVGNGAAATQATASGTFSTFGGKVVVNNGVMILTGTNALGSATAGQVVLSGNGAFGTSVSAGVNQAFLARIANAATTSGVFALGVASSSNLNFSSTPNLRLGSAGAFTYSGTLTPGGNGYQLGGGGGTLTVSSSLTGSNGLAVGGGVTLTGAGNTFSGGITIAGRDTASDYAARLNYTGGTGVLPSNDLSFSGIGGTFAYTSGSTGSTQSMGALAFNDGFGTVLSTYGTSGTAALTFSSLAARTPGAAGNVNTSGGTNGTTNKISVSGLATGLVDKGVFFNSSNYAYNDAAGFLRAPVYGTDADFVTSGATASLAGGAGINQQITGAISAQNTAAFNTLRISGTSNLTLAAAQTVTVDGILKAGGNASTISSGAGIRAASGAEMVVHMAASGDSVTISTPVLDNGGSSLTKAGAGTLTLTAANTYTGTTTVAQGTLTVSGAGRLADASSVVVSGGTYNVSVSDTVNSVTLENGIIGGSSTLTAGSFNLQNGQVNAILAGSGGLTKNTEGLVMLTAGNTYSGNTTINAGSLVVIGRGAALPAATAVELNGAGSSLDLSGITASGVTIGSLAGNVGSTLRIGSKALSVGGVNTTTTFNGILAGLGGSLTKSGTGTLTLTGANTFSGATTISGGVLSISGTGSLANTSGVSIADAAGLLYTGGAGTFDRNITVTGGTGSVTNAGAGVLTLAGTLSKNGTVLRLAGGEFNVSGQIVGANANSDLLVDAATVTLSNTNSYNGPTFVQNAGTLVLGVADAIPANSAVTLAGSTLTVGGYTNTIGSLSTSGNSTINVAVNGASSGGLSMGDLSFGGGTNTLAVSMTSPTAGIYNLLTYSGSKTGSFTATGVDPNYTLLTGSASNSAIALQRKADVGTVSASAAAAIITGGSTAIGYTVANTTPTGGATLAFTTSNGSNVAGSSSGSASANATSGTISGLFFTGTSIGLSQIGSFTVQDLGAITTTGTGSVSVTVLDHATPAFVGVDPATTNLLLDFGTVDQAAGLQTVGYSLTNLASAFGDSLTAGLALTGFAHDAGDTLFDTGLTTFADLLASGTSTYTASFTPSTAGTFSEVFRLSFSDNQSLAGAAQRRDLTVTMNVVVVPEPGALVLAGLGVAAAAWGWSRRKSRV